MAPEIVEQYRQHKHNVASAFKAIEGVKYRWNLRELDDRLQDAQAKLNTFVASQTEECGQPAEYCDSVPNPAAGSPHRHHEFHYRLMPLCWVHMIERKELVGNTARIEQLLRCEKQGLGRLDRDRAGGDCICPDCGRKYYDHPQEQEHAFLNLLCDGSVVKL